MFTEYNLYEKGFIKDTRQGKDLQKLLNDATTLLSRCHKLVDMHLIYGGSDGGLMGIVQARIRFDTETENPLCDAAVSAEYLNEKLGSYPSLKDIRITIEHSQELGIRVSFIDSKVQTTGDIDHSSDNL